MLGFLTHNDSYDTFINPGDGSILFNGSDIVFVDKENREHISHTMNHALDIWLKEGNISPTEVEQAKLNVEYDSKSMENKMKRFDMVYYSPTEPEMLVSPTGEYVLYVDAVAVIDSSKARIAELEAALTIVGTNCADVKYWKLANRTLANKSNREM
jgi:hypothetical protein